MGAEGDTDNGRLFGLETQQEQAGLSRALRVG
jgi:hypothetical protein